MTDADERGTDETFGWVVAVIAMVALVFTAGTPYSYGVFIGAFDTYFDHSSVALSSLFSVELFVFYAGAGVIGFSIAGFRVQRVMYVTGLITIAIAPSLFVIERFVGLVIIFGVLGAALGTVFVLLISVVPQWFEVYRGTATGILMMGIGLSLFLLPPIWQFAFARLGVPIGFATVVSISGLMFLLAGTVCRRPPWESTTSLGTRELFGWGGSLLRQRRFRYLLVGVGLSFTWYFLLAAFAVDLFESRGSSRAIASVLFGSIGGVSIVSRLGGGAVADKWGYRQTMLLSILCAGLGVLLLFPAIEVSPIPSVLLIGLGLGGISTLYIPIILKRFRTERSTAVVGIFNISLGFFAPLAPPVATAAVGADRTFDQALTLVLGTVLAALLFVWLGTKSPAIDGG